MTKWNVILGSITALAAVVIFLVVGIKAIQINLNDTNRRLEMVHIIMRHGERTPASTYPKDPHKDNPLYPVGWGQLTNKGKLSLYEIGKYYRERYGKFVGDSYSPDEYYTQSTDVDRAKASMQLVNAGFWPPKGDQVWGPLDWQPIPVHSEPLEQDGLLLVRKPCPKYHIEKEKVQKSKEVQDLLKEYEELFKELNEITGQEVHDFEDVQDIYTTLQAEERFGLKLPNWTHNYYPSRMHFPTVRSFVLKAFNDNMNRLIGGVLLKKLIGDWTTKIEGKNNFKAILYGGHDQTVVNLLSTLKVWDEQFPEFAIAVFFELYKDTSTNEYGVEIYLRNSTQVPPFKLIVPGCTSFCPLTKLKQLTKNVIPDKWEEECQIQDKNYVVPELRGP